VAGLIPYFFYPMWDLLAKLEKETAELKKEIRELKEKLDQLRPVHIDKLEYKIHELEIDTLSGTLNVGLTANGDDSAVGEIIEKIVDEHRSSLIGENRVGTEEQDGSSGPVDSP
jgi:spore germination protein PC